jgi:CBS domain-containing membrane protein
VLGEHSCRSIMQGDIATAQFGDSLEDVWETMSKDRLKAVVVVDRARRVIGIVTIVDFLKQAGRTRTGRARERLRALLAPSPGVTSEKPEVVGQIMSAPVVTVQHDAHMVTLIPLFTRHAIHHVPVLDDEHRLVGMVTQSDLMAALYRLRGALS